MATLTILGHICALVYMVVLVLRLRSLIRFNGEVIKTMVLIGFAGLFILLVHIAGIWLWAVLFLFLDAVPDLETALYFSTSTATTTVGYGDIVLSTRWRLLGSFEAIAGMIVFGISAAFLIAVLRENLKKFSNDAG